MRSGITFLHEGGSSFHHQALGRARADASCSRASAPAHCLQSVNRVGRPRARHFRYDFRSHGPKLVKALDSRPVDQVQPIIWHGVMAGCTLGPNPAPLELVPKIAHNRPWAARVHRSPIDRAREAVRRSENGTRNTRNPRKEFRYRENQTRESQQLPVRVDGHFGSGGRERVIPVRARRLTQFRLLLRLEVPRQESRDVLRDLAPGCRAGAIPRQASPRSAKVYNLRGIQQCPLYSMIACATERKAILPSPTLYD